VQCESDEPGLALCCNSAPPARPPPPPYYPAPGFESRCNGNLNPNVDCGVSVHIDRCPPIHCERFAEEGVYVQLSQCLYITKPFHMAFLTATCVDTHHEESSSTLADCISLSEYGMGKYLTSYASGSGLILSNVLGEHYDPRLSYTTAPATGNDCETVMPLRARRVMTIQEDSRTQVFSGPSDYYVVIESTLPPHSPPPPSLCHRYRIRGNTLRNW